MTTLAIGPEIDSPRTWVTVQYPLATLSNGPTHRGLYNNCDPLHSIPTIPDRQPYVDFVCPKTPSEPIPRFTVLDNNGTLFFFACALRGPHTAGTVSIPLHAARSCTTTPARICPQGRNLSASGHRPDLTQYHSVEDMG